MNGMHIIYVPPSVLKNFPAMWLQMVTKHRGELQFISVQLLCIHNEFCRKIRFTSQRQENAKAMQD